MEANVREHVCCVYLLCGCVVHSHLHFLNASPHSIVRFIAVPASFVSSYELRDIDVSSLVPSDIFKSIWAENQRAYRDSYLLSRAYDELLQSVAVAGALQPASTLSSVDCERLLRMPRTQSV